MPLSNKDMAETPEKAAVPKTSVAKELFKSCNTTFWKWLFKSFGLEDVASDVADDVTTHGHAVRKASALKFLIIFALIVGLLVYWRTSNHFIDEHGKEEKLALSDFERKLDVRDVLRRQTDESKHQTERKLDIAERDRNEAEKALAPWMELANKEFKDAPLNKRLDLLFDRADGLIKSMQESNKAIMQFEAANTDSIIKTIKENSAARVEGDVGNQSLVGATFNAEVFVSSKEQVNSNTFGGGFIGFGQGAKALLIASGPMYLVRQMGNDQVSYSLAFSSDSSKIPQDQIIASLLDSDYLEISFGSMPKGSIILGGKAVVILNGNIRLQFDVPGQTTTEPNAILVPDVKPELLRVLGKK